MMSRLAPWCHGTGGTAYHAFSPLANRGRHFRDERKIPCERRLRSFLISRLFRAMKAANAMIILDECEQRWLITPGVPVDDAAGFLRPPTNSHRSSRISPLTDSGRSAQSFPFRL